MDVNVLVYACRKDAPGHRDYRRWMESRLAKAEPYAVSELVLSGALRILTHPRVFAPPTPLATAHAYVEAVRSQPNAVPIAPGSRHWDIFSELCVAANARGNLVADAYLAALAIEHGCEWVTTDRDFARFPGLRWSHPLDGASSP